MLHTLEHPDNESDIHADHIGVHLGDVTERAVAQEESSHVLDRLIADDAKSGDQPADTVVF